MIKQRTTTTGKINIDGTPSKTSDHEDDNDKYHDLAPKPKLLINVALIVVSLFAVVELYSSSSNNTENMKQQQQRVMISDNAEKKKSSLRRSSAVAAVPVLPKEVKDGTYASLWSYYKCEDHFSTVKRPKDHGPTWDAMRRAFIAIMKPEQSMVKRLLTEPTAIQVPYEVREIQDKGLGLFATVNIKKGSVVDDLSRGGRVKFHSGLDFKKFLNLLQAPDHTCLALRCSAIESTTRETSDPQKGAFIAVDLDDSCFMNDEDVGPTVGGLNTTDCDNCDYALRDIQAGEELQCGYLSYVFEDGWKWFEMLGSDGGDDDDDDDDEESGEEEEAAKMV